VHASCCRVPITGASCIRRVRPEISKPGLYSAGQACGQRVRPVFTSGLRSAGEACVQQPGPAPTLHPLGREVVVGNPPSPIMEDACMASPFGVVMAGKDTARSRPALGEHEVKLAFGLGEWVAQVAKARGRLPTLP